MTWAKCQVVICKFTQRIGLWDGCGEGCKLQLPCKIDCTHSYTYSMSGTQFAHTELSHTQNFHIWSCTSLCVVCVCVMFATAATTCGSSCCAYFFFCYPFNAALEDSQAEGQLRHWLCKAARGAWKLAEDVPEAWWQVQSSTIAARVGAGSAWSVAWLN